MQAMRIYSALLAARLGSQLQDRWSFLMETVGSILITGSAFVVLISLFARFGGIAGWSLAEVALFYGVVHSGFGLAKVVALPFHKMPSLVKSGEFDAVLLRPCSPALQILGANAGFNQLGRLAQGVTVLVWAVVANHLGAAGLVLITWAVLGGACLFAGLMVAEAALTFWTVDSLELSNCLTYGGEEAAQFPLSIYRPGFRWFFTAVVPLACVAYFPVVAALGRVDPLGSPRWFQCLAPLAGILFLVAASGLWRLAIRHYTSSGN